MPGVLAMIGGLQGAPSVPGGTPNTSSVTSSTVSGDHTYTVPAGAGRLLVELWGAGGGGGGGAGIAAATVQGGSGGGGGAYVRQVVEGPLSPTYAYHVGAKGIGGAGGTSVSSGHAGANGAASTFGGGLYVASGGVGGHVDRTGGQGGNPDTCIGDVIHGGGAGAANQLNTTNGDGAGSSAGPSHEGTNNPADTQAGAVGPGESGTGGAGGNANVNGLPGVNPGGGGGGGGAAGVSSGHAGGTAADGKVRISTLP